MVMVVVATLTRTTAACSLGQEGRCAEDGVSGVEEREDKGAGKDERERVCGVEGGGGKGKGRERKEEERGISGRKG